MILVRAIPWLSVVCLGLVFTALNAQPKVEMTEAVFIEIEPGLEPYHSRVLVNEFFVRLDDGSDAGDFVLYDRTTREIHSINHEESTHFLIRPQQRPAIEFELEFTHEKRTLQDAPRISGITPVQHQFFADAIKCKQSINVDGFLNDMVRALIDYEQALVEYAKKTLSRVPASVKTACYMANNYLHASDYLKVGFPLQVTDNEGRQKRLLSFQKVLKPASMITIPAAYSPYYPDE